MSRHLSMFIRLSATLGGLLVLSSPAWALYKVVGPDGRVTYTDRPPVDKPAISIKTNGSVVAADNLPFELKQVVSRYPVTLYSSSKCSPCDAGRQFLQTRGIPFVERTVQTPDDIKALQRLENNDQVPILKVGSKQLQGYSVSEWTSYLDAAGYPAKSALPANYRQPAATPLAPPAAASAPEVAPTKVEPAPTAPTSTPGASPGFRF